MIMLNVIKTETSHVYGGLEKRKMFIDITYMLLHYQQNYFFAKCYYLTYTANLQCYFFLYPVLATDEISFKNVT